MSVNGPTFRTEHASAGGHDSASCAETGGLLEGTCAIAHNGRINSLWVGLRFRFSGPFPSEL
jgi:hypothetical protein